MNSGGVNRLARVLDGRISEQQIQNAPMGLDYGTIQADMSLLPDRFVTIPAGEYGINAKFTKPQDPADPEALLPGARVLVAWVGDDPTVLCVLRGGGA
jgi:hypothetical protein